MFTNRYIDIRKIKGTSECIISRGVMNGALKFHEISMPIIKDVV